MRIAFRQGIVSYQTDSQGTMQFLQPSSGGVTLLASTTPTLIAFAQYSSNYLLTERNTVVNAWPGPFDPSKSYWLYWDINLKTGVRTFGSTTLQPIISPPFTSVMDPAMDQHWFNTDNHSMYVWVGYWKSVVRVFAAKYNGGGVFVSMSNNAPLFAGTQVGLNYSVNAGALIFDDSDTPLKRGNGTFFTTEDHFVTAIGTSAGIKAEFAIVLGKAKDSIPSFSAVTFVDFDHIDLADPYTASTKVVGIVTQDALQGDVLQVVTSGTVTNVFWSWEDVNQYVYVDPLGCIVNYPSIPNQTPIGVTVNARTILLQVPTSVANGTSGLIGPQGLPGQNTATMLEELTDVNLTNVQDGDTLVYNAATAKWVTGAAYNAGKGIFVYKAGEAMMVHTIVHNIGSQYCVVQVIDDTNNAVIPGSIVFDTTNQLTVSFDENVQCTVVIIGLYVPGS